MIEKQKLEESLNQLEASLQEKIDDADSKARMNQASDSYRADMKGFSRGLYHGMHEILDTLRGRFL